MQADRWRKIVVFGLVGVGASVLHFIIAAGVDWAFDPSIYISNTIGFLIAFGWSYLGHYHLTFQSTKRHSQAVPRFALTAVAGYLINSSVVAVCVTVTGTESLWFILLAIAVAAAAVFVISNYWALAGKS